MAEHDRDDETGSDHAARRGGDPEPDRRWAQAESILTGVPTDEARRQVRRRRARMWVLIASLIVVAAGTGVVVGIITDPGSPQNDEVSRWREISSFVFLGVGLVVEAVGVVLMVRRGMWGSAWRAPTSVLTWRQRRQLSRQVLGREAVDARRVGLARDLASRLIEQRVVLVVYAGLPLMWAGRALGDASLSATLWGVAGVLSYPVLLVLMERQVRRAQRFLDRFPVPEV